MRNIQGNIVGWYDNPQGTGKALSKDLSFTVTEYVATTYYAVYTGGPYHIVVDTDGNGTAYGGEDASADFYIDRGTTITVNALGNDGMSFAGWYEIGEGDAVVGEVLSTNPEDSCSYTLKPTKDMHLRATFATGGVSIRLGYTTGALAEMGKMKVLSAGAVNPGSNYRIQATANPGYQFYGWYADEEATTLLSQDLDYTGTVSSDESGNVIRIYGKFAAAGEPWAQSAGENGIVNIKDLGQQVTKVFYQYSGTAKTVWTGSARCEVNDMGEIIYPAMTTELWSQFYKNGLGKDLNGNRKSDYSSNSVKYGWNGTSGYKVLSTNVGTTSIFVDHEGWYTFFIYRNTGDIVVHDIYVSASDLEGELAAPLVTNNLTRITLHDNGTEISNAYIQLTSTDYNASSCPVQFSSWQQFISTGKAEGNINENGVKGYKTMPQPFNGSTVKVNTAGWYTIFVKYSPNQSRALYIKITPENVEDTLLSTQDAMTTLIMKQDTMQVNMLNQLYTMHYRQPLQQMNQ